MKKKFSFLLSLVLMTFVSCATDIVDTSGSISGFVKDSYDNHTISNCNVTLSPLGKSVLTENDGQYRFDNIDVGTYTLIFSKTGYEDNSKTVVVNIGQNSECSVLLKSNGAFVISDNVLDFAETSNSLILSFANNTGSPCSCSINNVPSWALFSETKFTVPASNTKTIQVSVDRDFVELGNTSKSVEITYSGSVSGKHNVTLIITKNSPIVSISPATNIKYNSFDLSGEVVSTGGQGVTYGFCWNTQRNPSVNDKNIEIDATTSPTKFNYTVSDLSSETKYYIRAFAKTKTSVVYSDEIEAMTVVDQSFMVSPKECSFYSSGGKETINVTSDKEWEVSQEVSWLNVNKKNGTGNGTFEISVEPNQGDKRTSTVTVKSGNKSATISITQNGLMEVTPTSLSFVASGGSETIKVSSDVPWTVTTDSQWISLNKNSGNGNESVSVTASKNNSINNRTGYITFKTSNSTKTISVSQSGSSNVTKEGYSDDVKY